MPKHSKEEIRLRDIHSIVTYLILQLVPLPFLYIIHNNVPSWLMTIMVLFVSGYALLIAHNTHANWLFTAKEKSETGD